VRRKWQLNCVSDDNPEDLEEESGESLGYEFEWGQIREEQPDPDRLAKRDDPPLMCVRWHFVLVDLYDEFLNAGGNLGELADLALADPVKFEELCRTI
jgi:hypothetical protein